MIHDVYPYLRARDAQSAVEFYQRAFGATEKFRLMDPDGRIGHVELAFGSTTIMLSSEYPELGIVAPPADAPNFFAIHLHVDDADAMIATAVDLGAHLVRAPQDMFYGERSGTIRDPFGYHWLIGHSIEELSPDEMQRRYDRT
jgi:uncharacterized glyoxalase superfamily protein PhnB